MIQNYFKTAWRNLMKNKFYSALNISGLAIGLAVGIMVLLWVQDEFAYDGFHKNADRIYKINSHFGKGPDAQVWEDSPAPLAGMFMQSVPEVLDVVRINPRWERLPFSYGNKKMMETSSAYVDPSFFSVFDFRLIQGNARKPFPDNYSVVLTRSVAKKFFEDQDPIGKTMVSGKETYLVTGVIEDFPGNSGIRYNMLFPLSLYGKKFTEWGGNGDWKTIDEDLGNYQYFTYVQLRQNTSPTVVSQKITKLFRDRKGPEAKDDFFALQPLRTIHLVTADGNENALQVVQIFLIVAILILCIACINYVNLSTARSVLRSKEVSIRKMIGAERTQLLIQFLVESTLVFLLATMLAFFLIYLLLPLYNEISGKNLLFSLSSKNVWLIVASTIAATMILSAIYPALLLSSFKPIQTLKGKLVAGVGNAPFRKVLVVTQFVFSIGLIISTIVIQYQLSYIKERNLGLNKEHVLSFGITQEMSNHIDALKTELAIQPGIVGVASSNNSVVGVSSTTGDTDWDGKAKGREFMVHPNGIDETLIPLLKIQMLAGSNFTGAKADSAYVILNETAVNLAGIKDPVGKRFSLWNTRCIIKGVVKDFNYASLKYAVEPAVFYFSEEGSRFYIKTTARNASKAIASSQKIWKQYNSDHPFEYSFLDDDFDSMYNADQRTGVLFNLFAAIAIIISCLGLFGLASYTAEVKTKEIGIRKVLGATIIDLTSLLAKDFVLLVFAAFLIASPIAWFAMNKWLENYSYRVNVSWWVFLITGLTAVAIALLTVSFQAIKTAIANPVNSLRAE